MSSTKKENNLIIKILSHRILFAIHAFVYVAVNLLLVLIWTVTLGLTENKYFWPFFAIFGWGFGVGFHALVYLMYNDLVKYLTKIREQSTLGIIFIFHAWFYIVVNIFLLITNLTSLNMVNLLWFPWALGGWGIGFAFHAVGFFTWEDNFNKQLEKLRTKGDYSEKHMKKIANAKIAWFWILLIHISYFIVVNILIYTSGILDVMRQISDEEMTNPIYSSISWSIILLLHIVAFYLYSYVEKIKPVLKGFMWHAVAFVSLNIYAIIYQFAPDTPIIWIQYPTILWGIVLALHGLVVFKWDSIKKPALEKVKSIYKNLEEFEYNVKANRRIFWQSSFIFHIPVYIIGVILIGVQFSILGIDSTLLVYPIMGWLIGLCVHLAIFICVWKNITDFWKWTALLHLGAYIPTSILLVIINTLILPEFLWSVIAMGGWGIGFGVHLLIAILVK